MLKKITMLLFAVILTSTAFAQNDYNYKKFRVDLGGGAAIFNKGGGFLMYIEPKLAIHPNFSAGIRILDAVVGKNLDINGQTYTTDISNNSSFLLTGDYYFTSSTARPYVGAGIGLYNNVGLATNVTTTTSGSNGGTSSNTVKYDIPASNNFGAMVRAGVDVVHLRMGLEYNFVPSTSSQSGVTNVTDVRAQNSYLGLTFGGYFGGGKLK